MNKENEIEKVNLNHGWLNKEQKLIINNYKKLTIVFITIKGMVMINLNLNLL